jgi:hypothetical protein
LPGIFSGGWLLWGLKREFEEAREFVAVSQEGLAGGSVEPEEAKIVSGEAVGVFEGQSCLAASVGSADGHELTVLKCAMEFAQGVFVSNKERIAREGSEHKRGF